MLPVATCFTSWTVYGLEAGLGTREGRGAVWESSTFSLDGERRRKGSKGKDGLEGKKEAPEKGREKAKACGGDWEDVNSGYVLGGWTHLAVQLDIDSFICRLVSQGSLEGRSIIDIIVQLQGAQGAAGCCRVSPFMMKDT